MIIIGILQDRVRDILPSSEAPSDTLVLTKDLVYHKPPVMYSGFDIIFCTPQTTYDILHAPADIVSVN